MKILLIDVDGKLPNLVLMKLSAWYKALGYEVCLLYYTTPKKVSQKALKEKAMEVWNKAKLLGFENAEHTFISTLFTWNRPQVEELLKYFLNAEVGGTGWDFTPKNGKWQGKSNDLPLEIEALKPDYGLYTTADIYERIKGGIGTKAGKLRKAETIVNAGMGFTSRGCIRACDFCLVYLKEGVFHQVAEIGDLLNPRSKTLILLDNNLTADPNCIDKLHEIRDRGLTVDISQGIDVRLLTPEMAEALSQVRHLRQLHYAWDLMPFERQIKDGIKMLSKRIKPSDQMCFMLTGFNTEFDEDMYRYEKLREWGVRPYVMPYNKVYTSKRHHCFTSWINGMYYTVCKFADFEPWVKAQSDMQLSMF